MKYPKCIALFAVFLLLALAAGCQRPEAKPLWQRLEDAQYNRYKPRLNHMVEKYGDMFTMDVYGEVYCTNPEYKDWHIGIGGEGDDFAIRLRRDELEAFMMEIAQPIFGQCKVYIHGGYPNALGADAKLEDFFTYNDEWGLVDYCVYVPYSEEYQQQGEAFIEALKARRYTLSNLNILFVEEDVYPQAGRERGTFGELPEGYRFRLHSGHYDKMYYSWIENTSLTHMTEKYGDMFKMKLDGTITCTEPEYQDWNIIISNNTNKEYPDKDNFAARLRREDLERYMQEIAEPVFGECKVYLTNSRASTLDVDAETKGFLAYDFGGNGNPLLSYCICVPFSDDYEELANTFGQTLLENWHSVASVTILYFDAEEYKQIERLPQVRVHIEVGTTEVTGAEGYKTALYTSFSRFNYSEYHWGNEDAKKIYWYKAEGNIETKPSSKTIPNKIAKGCILCFM